VKVYRCLNHNVILTLQDNKRVVETSIRLVQQCYLLKAKEPEEGQHGHCRVEKLS
jgi:hypothetical protein